MSAVSCSSNAPTGRRPVGLAARNSSLAASRHCPQGRRAGPFMGPHELRSFQRLHADPRCRGRAADIAVRDGEAILLRAGNTSDVEGLDRGRATILVAYDVMDLDGHDVRPEP